MNNITRGRTQLGAWLQNKPTNFFKHDINLQNVLRQYLSESTYENAQANLQQVGEQVATVLDDAAKIEDHIGNHPRLQRWSGIGERIEEIEFHPNHDKIGQLVWQSGIMAIQADSGRTVEQMGLYYLLTQNGEGGHLCSLACTAGLIRALQTVASPEIQAKFLPPLLDKNFDTMQHGAQFLTEVQGGSDVGANAVTVRNFGDGTWRITGEKWFCSNINADQFLMTARPENAPQGTKGLGLFLVPRKLDDGSVNGFYIRRLKEKIGTRTLASAEVDFVDAVAYPVGAIDEGFKNAVELVLNTSRLMNAIACSGVMHRAWIEAGYYACNREAFGQAIVNYPLVQEAIADILSETLAGTSLSFYVAHLVDLIDTQQATEDQIGLHRLLVNICKYITSIRGTETIHKAIEVLGGNGAIESFSILPRLYRDMIVLESWEGTHNVLCLQVLRDIQRYQVHEPFLRDMHVKLQNIQHAELQASKQITQTALQNVTETLQQLSQKDAHYAQAHARRLIDDLSHIAQAVLLLVEAQWEFDHEINTVKPQVIDYFVNRRLQSQYNPMQDENYLSRIEHIMTVL